MAIDFESFIADPNITDPGIDVSGIKTTTPTDKNYYLIYQNFLEFKLIQLEHLT